MHFLKIIIVVDRFLFRVMRYQIEMGVRTKKKDYIKANYQK